jgi:hypothetical protein
MVNPEIAAIIYGLVSTASWGAVDFIVFSAMITPKFLMKGSF